MRMSGEGETLAELLERADVAELTRILREFGEEPFARPVARALRKAVETHGARNLDTARLAEVVAGAIPRKAWPRNIHPATRTFQALRIAVNDELGALAAWLEALPRVVAKGGRAAAISFHSLEDRMVKRAFQQLTRSCTCPPGLPVCRCGSNPEFRAVTKRAVRPTEDEVARNPRARSARLRAVVKVR
jgi:16S rRNA (cytosine1402-N4)-methyltransferase